MLNKHELFQEIMRRTQIAHLPKSGIATFGITPIEYYFLASLADRKTRVREGKLMAAKPLIILPHAMDNLVEGFDGEIKEFARMLFESFGPQIRMLGYQFRHQPSASQIENDSFDNVLLSLSRHIADNRLAAIIVGEERSWEVSVFKLLIKMIQKSFRMNITELAERGFFDTESLPPRLKTEIEILFHACETQPQKLKELGHLLVQNGLFSQYEDRFFTLLKDRDSHERNA